MAKTKEAKNHSRSTVWKQVKVNWQMYLFLLLPVIWLIVFKYVPMYGAQIAFRDYTIQGGVQAVEELVKENPDMTAVFVTNYEMTMGAVIGLNEMGVSMPEEISLVGFDNLPFARACRPALTIVSQPTEKIARETAQIMLERLEGRDELPDHIVRKLQTDIFMGKSIRRQG